MAYRLRAKGKPANELGRVLRNQNRKAQELLADWERDPAVHIHKARQCCKRIRALLWLLRPRHDYVYQVENSAYRDLSKSLAYARDASAMVEAADRLAERIWEPGPRQSLLMLGKSLAAQAESEFNRALTDLTASVHYVQAELPLLDRRIRDLPLESLQRKHLRKGARLTLARARRDFQRLDLNSPPEAYHNWRKHVKYVYYQTRLMAEILPEWSRRYRQATGELAELLGNAQDLEVLNVLLASQPDALGIDINWQRLRRLVSAVQRDLHMQAIAMGRQLFEGRDPGSAHIVRLPTPARRA